VVTVFLNLLEMGRGVSRVSLISTSLAWDYTATTTGKPCVSFCS
jgi:hypothetical protein